MVDEPEVILLDELNNDQMEKGKRLAAEANGEVIDLASSPNRDQPAPALRAPDTPDKQNRPQLEVGLAAKKETASLLAAKRAADEPAANKAAEKEAADRASAARRADIARAAAVKAAAELAAMEAATAAAAARRAAADRAAAVKAAAERAAMEAATAAAAARRAAADRAAADKTATEEAATSAAAFIALICLFVVLLVCTTAFRVFVLFVRSICRPLTYRCSVKTITLTSFMESSWVSFSQLVFDKSLQKFRMRI